MTNKQTEINLVFCFSLRNHRCRTEAIFAFRLCQLSVIRSVPVSLSCSSQSEGQEQRTSAERTAQASGLRYRGVLRMGISRASSEGLRSTADTNQRI